LLLQGFIIFIIYICFVQRNFFIIVL
jgi:hypothetical protein